MVFAKKSSIARCSVAKQRQPYTSHSTVEKPGGASDVPSRSHAEHISASGTASTTSEDENESLSWPRLAVVGVALWFAVFLYSLVRHLLLTIADVLLTNIKDQTIVSNAVPAIVGEFKSVDAAGWYGSSYLLTTSAFQLLFGRIYSTFDAKKTLLIAISIFELGSLICAVAPTSNVLIAGRAIAGVGCAGITSGTYVIIGHIFPLRIRPVCISTIAIVFAVAAVLGPVLGGIFTTNLTWRWCFYVNLPFEGFTIGVLCLFLPSLTRPSIADVSFLDKLKKLDFIGLAIHIPAIVSLLLALQWGGSTYTWNDGRIIGLLVMFGILIIAFISFERSKGVEATLPMHVITQRSVAAAVWNAFCNGGVFYLLTYYIPFWLQAIRGSDAASSGIGLLPFVLGVVIMANLVGFLVTKSGYYAPFMICASVLCPIGAGLMTTWTVDTPSSHCIGYQALTGLGIGMGQQLPQVAIQAVLPQKDVPAGASIVVLLMTLSGAVFIAIGQAVLQNELARNLHGAFPNGGIDIARLLNAGASELRSIASPQDVGSVLIAYNATLTGVFRIAAVMSALTIIGSLSIEWKSVKKEEGQR